MTKSDQDQRHPSAQPQPSSAEVAKEFALELSKGSDVALLAGPTTDGKGVTVLRAKQGQLQAGEVRPLEAGKPIVGEVVSLKPRQAAPLVCDVETHVPAPATHSLAKPGTRSGPPQVASDTYRQNWDLIYRGGQKKDLPN